MCVSVSGAPSGENCHAHRLSGFRREGRLRQSLAQGYIQGGGDVSSVGTMDDSLASPTAGLGFDRRLGAQIHTAGVPGIPPKPMQHRDPHSFLKNTLSSENRNMDKFVQKTV